MSFRDDLIAAMEVTAVQKPRAVVTPKWGTVYVRDVTVDDIDAQTEDKANPKDKRRMARGAARVICDEKGNRVFDPENDADVARLGKQPWPLLQLVLQEPDEGN